MTVAIYVRASTPDQNPEFQLVDLRAYCARRRWTAIEYVDCASGQRGAKHPEFDRLMADAKLNRFRAVIVWRLDRLGRSMLGIIERIQKLDAVGIRFIVPAQSIDTDSKSPFGKFLVHVLGAFAELERDLIVDRVCAGIAEAQRKGKHCGRPCNALDINEAVRLRNRGLSWRLIGGQLGVSFMTVQRAVTRFNRQPA